MDKISGILPSSPRVVSTDLKESGSVRPGAPGFGRPDGSSALKDRNKDTDIVRSSTQMQKSIQDWRTKEGLHSDVAKQIADRFFLNERNDVKAVSATPKTPANSHLAEVDLVPVERQFSEDELDESEPQGLYPKGSFIDFRA